ncbi:MAG: GvpL/GvpF family gas vesicle protein [Myxococcales bacterium]|jgi:hypothetical protein
MATMEEGGTYLYAVVPKAAGEEIGELSGVEDGKVYGIESGELTAVVSDVPTQEELRPERRLLAAHQRVLDRVTDASPAVLPVAFGTVAESRAGVRELLERYQEDFSQQMKRVEGKIELGVRLTYQATKPNLFEFLIANSPELRAERDRLAQSGRELTREEKIDLGQKVDAVLSALRDEYAERIVQALGDLGADTKRNPPRNENELVNLVVLVPKDRRADFDAAIESMGPLFPDTFVIEQVGPFPPYDFVEMHLTAPAAGEA